MKGHGFVYLLLAGLALAAAGLALGQGPPKDPPKGQDTSRDGKPLIRDRHGSYAWVELAGTLSKPSRIPGAGPGPVLHVAGDEYELDLSGLKEDQKEAVRKLVGEFIIVTGDLDFQRGAPGRAGMPQVRVSSVRSIR